MDREGDSILTSPATLNSAYYTVIQSITAYVQYSYSVYDFAALFSTD